MFPDSPNFSGTTIPKVLVVDDKQSIRDLMECITKYHFERTGQNFSFVVAANADKAEELLKDNSFNLVFMDIHMPGRLDGIGLIQLIRKQEVKSRSTKARIICITGDETKEFGTKAMSAGADECLFKPFSAQPVLDMLKSTFGA